MTFVSFDYLLLVIGGEKHWNTMNASKGQIVTNYSILMVFDENVDNI